MSSTSTSHGANGREAGFTLIELSIVLVIIGLIVGGILKGQEIIESTRLKATVSQWDATKAALNTFQDKYLTLPGDYSKASTKIKTGLNDGNGDGVIGAETAITAKHDAFDATTKAEPNNAWAHLQAADLIAGVQLAGTKYWVPAKVQGANLFIIYNSDLQTSGHGGHWLRIQGGTDVTADPTDALSPSDASEIDRKWDDDDPDNGAIQGAGVATATNCVTTGGAYKLSDADACVLAMQL